MALEMGMNLVCSVLEEVVMCVCQYLFMSANAQTIHRKKIWYFFGFTALGASVYGAAFLTGLTGNLWIGIQIQLTGVLLLGILLFHRKIGSLLLDLFVNILLILSIEVGIFLGNYLLASCVVRECYHALQNVFHDSCDSGRCYVEKETKGNRNGKLADTAPFITSAF